VVIVLATPGVALESRQRREYRSSVGDVGEITDANAARLAAPMMVAELGIDLLRIDIRRSTVWKGERT